jgi:hypothetical protein
MRYSMRLRKANRLRKDAELKAAHDVKPKARVEMKRDGLEVGKLVRYVVGEKDPDWAAHIGTVTKLHHNSVEVVMTGGDISTKYADMIIREDEIPYSQVKEILGPGYIPARVASEAKKLPLPPPRPGGYEFCDIGECENRPVMAYVIKKYDDEIGELGPAHIVAVCKGCDEPWPTVTEEEKRGIPSKKDSNIPILWRMGVVFDSWKIPKPEPKQESVEPTVDTESKSVLPVTTKTGSPYEGKRGRHPTDCACSRHGGK